MSEPTETSGRPLATTIKQEKLPDSTTTNAAPSLSTSTHQPTTSHTANDHCLDTSTKTKRRRPASTITAASGPHTGSSRIEQRPVPNQTMASQATGINYTKTGRVSKAKKGLKVHDCECGRSYTRAEHLRRHQKNHAQDGAMICRFPDCGREFVRLDLLHRHEERHIEIGDKPRRDSSMSSHGSPQIPQTPMPMAIPPQDFPAVTMPLQHAPPYFPSAPVTPVPEPAPASSRKHRPSISGQLRMPTDIMVGPSSHPQWEHSPSPSSCYPSPIPGPSDIPVNGSYYHHYGNGVSRHRALSDVSIADAWETRSPSSHTTMPTLWPYDQKPVANIAYMQPHYSMVPLEPGSDLNAMAGFGPYAKTMCQRDDEEGVFLFGEESYGMGQLAHSYPFEQFLNNYWRLFHPAFPIVHRSTFETMSKPPLLHAAMIAIGGQYSNDAIVKRKSRELHDSCMKMLEKRDLETTAEADRLCDYQAVFLIEVLSQYRARRAAKILSPRFGTLYYEACKNFSGRSMQAFEIFTYAHTEGVSEAQWAQWIGFMTWQHLLSACYILESQQVMLLAREPHSSMFQGNGFDLPIPAHPKLWAATSPQEWTAKARECPQTVQYLYEVNSATPSLPHTPFQSAMAIAANYNHFGLSQTFMDMTTVQNISHLIDNSVSTRYKLLTARLIRVTPIRALLAVSGESWILSEKVSSQETFAELRQVLRSWIRQLWPNKPNSNPSPASVKEALRLSIKILQLALSDLPDSSSLDIGSDMGIYFAALVLWALTAAATSRTRTASQTPQQLSMTINTDFPPSPPSPPQEPPSSLVTHTQILSTSKGFLKIALALASMDPSAQSNFALAQAQTGCVGLLLWVKVRLRGGPSERDVWDSRPEGGMGELCESVVGSIERMLRKGWSGWGI